MNISKLYIKPEEVESFVAVYQILQHAAKHYPNRNAYIQIENKTETSSVTFSDLHKRVLALRAQLIKQGYKDKHIAVIGETSLEWITVYLAIVSGVGVCVPIDKVLAPDTMAKQIDDADVELIFCSAKSLRKLQKALPLCRNKHSIAIMRSNEIPEIEGCDEINTLNALIELGSELPECHNNIDISAIDPDKTCIIIYTSGTTGANKGVMLSNLNVMGTLRGCARLLHYPATSISVLPVNHSYELHAHLMSCLYCGTTVHINDDLKYLLKNLERFKPEMSCMVPMMLDLIVRKIKNQIEKSGKKETFEKAVAFSNAARKVKIDLRSKLFKEVLEPLGGNLRMIICGGAALSQDTIDFLDSVGIQVYNGYGITECAPVVAVNPSAKVRRNSVGCLLPTMTARIAQPDENGNGEIQLFGDNVMKGYYKAEEDTEKVFTPDGWFRTGDIGHMDKDKFLFINGRLKNLIILPNGKNVSPEEIEDDLMKRMPYIKEVVVYSDKENTGIYAIIYPDREFCAGKSLNSADEIKKFMCEDINAYNSSVPSFKRITDYEITDTEFAKSTTLKIQRFKIDALNKNKKEVKTNV